MLRGTARAVVRLALFACVGSAVLPRTAAATEWFVAPEGQGRGTDTQPFGRIQDALAMAEPGDTVTVRPGTYRESIRTVRNGLADAPITLRAATRRQVIVTAPGRVMTVQHGHFIADGLVLDGQYGLDDLVRVPDAGHHLQLRDSELRRSSRDLIDLGRPDDVLIEGCLLHHALNPTDGRSDAHGVAAGSVRRLQIRDTEIHTFSGDGIQVDPGRAAPGWGDVTVERVTIWLAPLPAAENGFPAGAIPGENAVDTKASAGLPRATILVRDVTASGFRSIEPGNNYAAFNLKEHVDATIDRVTVFDSEIAFRLRGASTGGARVTITNAVVHDVLTAFRYEDDIRDLHIWNSTIGSGVTRVFQAASSDAAGLDVRNLLVLGALPSEARGATNRSARPSEFVAPAVHDYALAPTAESIDKGVVIPENTTDRRGVLRPQGRGYDVGAFEYDGAAQRARPIQPPTTGRTP